MRGGLLSLAASLGLVCTAGCMVLQEWFPAKTYNTGSRAGFALRVLPETMLGGAEAQFTPSTAADPDGSMLVEISAAQSRDLKALYAVLTYDPLLWQPCAVEWTDALAAAQQRITLAVYPGSPGGNPGELTLGCVSANWDKQPGFNGDGVLCRLRFTPPHGPFTDPAGGMNPAPARTTAAAPTTPGAAVQLSYDEATRTLSWFHTFPGDYDQNGSANITDLTQLGRHFGAASGGGPFPANTIEAQVDGDGNGEINAADITPLGQNFGRRIERYALYRSSSQASYPQSRGEAERTAEYHPGNLTLFGGGIESRMQFVTLLPAALAAGENIWARPVDGEERGTPSASFPDGWTVGSDPPPPPPPGELPAFPGAEGFGAFASGGRGGQVIYVTNLDTSGPGSLQAALDTPGPKYILFKVSGVINGHVYMTRGDVTVAGQTSPGGIIVRGWICDPDPYVEEDAAGLQSWPENFVLRHIRSRPDFDNATLGGTPSDDGLRLHHAVNGIVDHFSIANAADEAVQVSWSRDITIQNCLLAETLGDHAYLGGMLLNYGNAQDGWPLTRLSIHHNCWNRIMGRMPEISRESPGSANAVMELELSNNLLWDPGIGILVANDTFVAGAQPLYYAMNWVGNRAVGRASFPEPAAQASGWTLGMMSPDWLQLNPAGNSAYFNDNVCDNYPGFTDYQQLYCCNDYDQQVVNDPQGLPFPSNTSPGPFARAARHGFPAITYTPSSELADYMIENAGAFRRDAMDRRLMQRVSHAALDPARRDLKHPADDTFTLDFDPGNPPAPPLDSDGDGMPDTWELANGLDPNVQDHNGTQLSLAFTGVAGYTNLEVYLNELADSLTGAS